jgi:hypothetical protein
MGRASCFLKLYLMVLLYHIWRGEWDIFGSIFDQCCEQLKSDEVVFAY